MKLSSFWPKPICSRVGKSCQIQQYLDRHEVTIGVEFGAKIMGCCRSGTLQESFRSITRQYYRSAAILAYNTTRRETFEHIEDAQANGNPTISFILVGNKCDLVQNRQVSIQEGKQFADQHGLLFIEKSAKRRLNVDEVHVI